METQKIIVKTKNSNDVTPPTNPSPSTDDNDDIGSCTLTILTARKSVLLRLLNKFMANVNLPELKELTDFKDIDRDLIIKETNSKIIDNMSKELFMLFYKPTSKISGKKYPLNCLRSFAKQIGMNLTYKKRDLNVTIDGTAYRRTIYEYSLSK